MSPSTVRGEVRCQRVWSCLIWVFKLRVRGKAWCFGSAFELEGPNPKRQTDKTMIVSELTDDVGTEPSEIQDLKIFVLGDLGVKIADTGQIEQMQRILLWSAVSAQKKKKKKQPGKRSTLLQERRGSSSESHTDHPEDGICRRGNWGDCGEGGSER